MNAWAFLRDMCQEYTTTVNKKRRRFTHHIDLDEDDQSFSSEVLHLSKRWTHVWTQLKDLDFDDPETSNTLNFTSYAQPEIDKFVDRVNRVIIANQAPYLDTFRIQFPVGSSYDADIHYSNVFSSNPALILNTTLTSFHLAWADNDAASSKNHRKLVVSSLQLKHLEFIDSLKSLNIEVLCLSAPNLTSFIIYESKFDVECRSVPSFVDATFGCLYCYHIFQDLDTLSGFSSQLEKLSIRWHMAYSDFVYSQFPNFANVQQLEIVSPSRHDDLILSTSLIEACPLLHTFKLKMMCYYEKEVTGQISAPNYAQENAIRCHQHLKVVEYLGYHGCASAVELAICLARHAPMLQRFIFDTRLPRYTESLRRTSDYRDRVEIVRRTELLAKQIQRRQFPVDVVIL
ncbi:hypothetical protein POM88_019314 [Heracleum sosnowskyi]|uniref:At1g61320/AtMIF1 LRR domain-containing protein n=1 Tax=Heracleum sosnowskyi TaxID=360622 RepID=A0AAD8IUK9_9APIA|nr:hypothetical protein POM88_019314 [Heracleum sosnowskyi]